ncbi:MULTISPECIES: DUF4391 domain-containing protein [Fusobacterium]|uniref:DUF4391 domain-containing protein n=1 Tax=Fusobacterium hwasookii ChDC F206 TaxID=1307443 RepID=A0AAC9A1P4_9FUSO|nr:MULTISPECIES: DUF4391 domain-containing protein [Fusobacterium]ALQ36273.1 hypothetical protein RN92_10255 [Fusobacterium hwasookii ChDC F206]PHI16014.1 hypothetical protein CBG58_02605 [Fusobacterium polymorphum]
MLLDLPEKSEIKKIVSKKQIYEKYSKEFNSTRKKSFNDEIEKITFINEISKYSVNCEEGKEIKRIFVIKIDLKEKNFSDENISLISKLFNQKIIFLLANEDKFSLAIYQSKLFKTKFNNLESFSLKIEGLNLDKIWENFVLFISGYHLTNENDLNTQIDIETKKEKLRKEIEILERQARKEIQAKKAFELYKKIKFLKNELMIL